MAIKLHKNDSILLKKDNNTSLDEVVIGFSWEATRKGFLPMKRIDIDSSVVIYYTSGRSEVINFERPKLANESIKHYGDGNSDNEKDIERISFKFSQIPNNVSSMFLTLNSPYGQKLNNIKNPSLKIYEEDKKIISYTVEESYPSTALILAKVEKDNDGVWKILAIGKYMNASNTQELSARILKYAI